MAEEPLVEPVPVSAVPREAPAGKTPAVPEAPEAGGAIFAPGTVAVPAPTSVPATVSERAGDSDRDRVVTLLRDHCVAGRLTLDEFSERTGLALAARTRGELDSVLADLPADMPAASQPMAEVPRRRARRWIVAVMSESESKGRWRLGGHTSVVAVMGQCHVDLSRAEIDGPEILITALGIMGAIEIVVPEGIDVEVTGLSIMGRRSISMRDVPVLRGSPRIRVRAFPIMGEVNVTSRSAAGQLPGPAL
ncbi:MAG: DUF1707 domain-containing protein [Acidimicrobiales bacterium]|jgi:roadblock/LC7 domain-containing protein